MGDVVGVVGAVGAGAACALAGADPAREVRAMLPGARVAGCFRTGGGTVGEGVG